MITDVFGEKMKHTVLGDFEPLGQVKDPSMYVHICQKFLVKPDEGVYFNISI